MSDFTWKRAPQAKFGILCGADQSQEWLLPWWWSRYSEHNNFPVTFLDFGMTDLMKQWCRTKGELIPIELDSSLITPRSGIDEALAKQWEYDYGWRVWNSRLNWFKKPFAFLQSPYEKGIWVDLDCEVLGSLNPLFSKLKSTSQLALVRDHPDDPLPRLDPNVRYNGGVIVFKHGSRILQHLAENSLKMNHLFAGDDPLLSHLIYKHQLKVQELPMIYNWRMVWGLNLGAVILHWVGTEGKAYIRTHDGIKPSLDLFFQACRGRAF